MQTGVRLYRDGFPFVAAMRRVETGFLPLLEHQPGFKGTVAIRWRTGHGLMAASFADQEALRAAADLGNAWAAHHLADLLPELEPSALMAAEIIFARGQLR